VAISLVVPNNSLSLSKQKPQAMDNLILQAIGNDKVEAINKIKKNKEFLSKLIKDLGQVYTMCVTNQDDMNSTSFNIARYSTSKAIMHFTATENGITFKTHLLGYRVCNTKAWELGWIVEKYDTCKGDENFMREIPQPQGFVSVVLNFTDTSANLLDIIRDITRMMDKEQFAKRF
jgi:hypothetical protein